jgi:DNA-binding transcriptional MocR family regulator
MFLWAELGPDLAPGGSTADLLATAVDHGVAYVPGRAFAAGGPEAHDRHLRLSFATTDPAGLTIAVDRLADALGAGPT